MEDWQHGGFGLYVHWPFCQSKCPYCDFNSHVAARVDQSRWLRAYRSEIGRLAALTGPRVLQSVFFGGGTPSLMEPETVEGVLQAVRSAWPMTNDAEVTLEANPGSVEAARFAAYAEAGVNRISMGVQSLRDNDLRRLGRMHTVAEAKAAFDTARTLFQRVSFDLIYARQDQTLSDWREELTEALGFAADHLSLYQLTIEEGTVFGARHAAGHLKGLPDEDAGADMYLLTQDLCGAAGLHAYEVSNHAGAGAECRHNLVYWRCGDYAGVGPGAHGRLSLGRQRWATEAVREPGAWLRNVETAGTGEIDPAEISLSDQALEYLMMGLRLSEGLDVDRYRLISGSDFPTGKVHELTDLGLLSQGGGRLRTTNEGRAVLNGVIRSLAGA